MSAALLWVGVGALGGIAAIARFLVDGAIAARAPGGFPFGTLAVNVSGAVLLGLLVGLAVDGDSMLLAGTAVLGSYTTFSTWMFETQRLAEDGQWRPATVNIVAALVLGIAAAALGNAIGGL